MSQATPSQKVLFVTALVLFALTAVHGIFRYYHVSFSLSRGFGAIGYGTIQGFKVKGPGIDVSSIPPAGETVFLDGSNTTGVNANPYFFQNVPAGSHVISVTVPAGWSVGYTLCYNSTSCHTGSPKPGNSVAVDVPAGGYVDLWWHYTSTTPTTPPPITQNSITLLTPNGGERLTGDTNYTISWKNQLVNPGSILPNVSISWVRSDGVSRVIAKPQTGLSGGTFAWRVPDAFPPLTSTAGTAGGGNFRIKITLLTSQDSPVDESDSDFFIRYPYRVTVVPSAPAVEGGGNTSITATVFFTDGTTDHKIKLNPQSLSRSAALYVPDGVKQIDPQTGIVKIFGIVSSSALENRSRFRITSLFSDDGLADVGGEGWEMGPVAEVGVEVGGGGDTAGVQGALPNINFTGFDRQWYHTSFSYAGCPGDAAAFGGGFNLDRVTKITVDGIETAIIGQSSQPDVEYASRMFFIKIPSGIRQGRVVPVRFYDRTGAELGDPAYFDSWSSASCASQSIPIPL